MSGGNQKCSICNKLLPLSKFGKFKGFIKSICYDCERRKAEKKSTEVKKLDLTRNQHIAPTMKDVTIQHIQNMPKESLSEVEIAHKIKIMFGDKVEYCPFCETWKEISLFAPPEHTSLFVSRTICKDCKAKQSKKEEAFELLSQKPKVQIPEIKEIYVMPKNESKEKPQLKTCSQCLHSKLITDFYNPKASYCIECSRESARRYHQKKKADQKALKENNKTCSVCGKDKLYSEFYSRKIKNGSIYYHPECKECAKEAARKNLAKQREEKKSLEKKVETQAPKKIPIVVDHSLKVCKSCNKVKPVSEFYTQTNSKGHTYPRSTCKKCYKANQNYGGALKPKDSPLKLCKGCNTEKPTSEFHKHAKRYDGLQSFCKACNNTAARKKQKEAVVVIKPVETKKGESKSKCYFNETEKYCPRCSRILPNEKFSKDRSSASGLYLYCKDCERARKSKICRGCGEVKPYSEFYFVETSGGRKISSKECKACLTPEALTSTEPTPKKNTQICGICNKELPMVEFYSVIMGDLSVKHTKECKACLAGIVVKFAEEDKPFVEKKEPAERKYRIPRKKVLKRVVTRIETYLL